MPEFRISDLGHSSGPCRKAATPPGVLAVLLLAAALTGCAAPASPPPAAPLTGEAMVTHAQSRVPVITVEQLHDELAANPDLFVLNVCEWIEHERLHIPGSVLIPRGLLEFKIAANDLFPAVNRGRSPRRDQPIVVYCAAGGRSLLAGETLLKMGYTNVRSARGGISEWKRMGYPVERH